MLTKSAQHRRQGKETEKAGKATEVKHDVNVRVNTDH